ncbi:hypothetical protein ACFX2C_029097 [Malus domestica]
MRNFYLWVCRLQDRRFGQLECREILAHFSERVVEATVLGLSSLISEHGFVHMGTMTTVSSGICDESGGGAWSCKL